MLLPVGIGEVLNVVGQVDFIRLLLIKLSHLCSNILKHKLRDTHAWSNHNFGIGPSSRVQRGLRLRFLESQDLHEGFSSVFQRLKSLDYDLSLLDVMEYWYSVVLQSGKQSQEAPSTRAISSVNLAVFVEL